MFPGRGAVPVPVLYRGRLRRGLHLEVGQDKRVAIHRVGASQLGQGQGTLVRVQGPATSGAGIRRDLLGGQRDPADEQPGVGWPPGRAVARDGDLGAGHVGRVGPVRLAEPGQGLPEGGDAFGADRELDPFPVRGHRQVHREVPAIRAQLDLTHPGGQATQRAAQQPRRPGAGILIAGQQVRGQRHLQLGPAGHVRAPGPLALVVVGHPTFLAAIDLHIGGVQIDRHRPQQRLAPRARHPLQHPGGHRVHPGLHRRPLLRADPPGQSRRGGRAQPRHRHQLLARDIGAQPIQPDR